jgi:hypothetical protein
MHHHLPRRTPSWLLLPAVVLASTLLVATGCGTSSGSGGTSGGGDTTEIAGQAIAGAVRGTVTVTDEAGTAVATAAVRDGEFTVPVPDAVLDGELDFLVLGSYTDEISGETVNLTPADPLALRTAAGRFVAGQPANAPITPGSTVVRWLVEDHAMGLGEARDAFQAAFGYAPDMAARPFDATRGTPAGANDADRDAAFRAGVFSQLASDLGITGDAIAGLARGLADDLADGTLDGRGGAGDPVVAGGVDLAARHGENPMSARLLSAHGAFVASPANAGELAAPTRGLPAMVYDAAGATRTVVTAGGRTVTVTLDTTEEPPFVAGFWTGRVAHEITLTDADDQDTPIDITTDPTIVDVSHHPLMHMLTGHDHTTPHAHEPDASGAASGQYLLDAYYVMASEMGMGAMAMPMGVWDYTVKIAEDTDGDAIADATTGVIFHPQVAAPMDGAVLFAQVNHENDTWTSMDGTTGPRPYRVWLHEAIANGDGTHALTLFISTQDMADMGMAMDGMSHGGMTFPAVRPGQALHGPVNGMDRRPEVSVDTVVVDVSTDDGMTWAPLAEEAATGRYQVVDLPGLDNGAGLDTLTVRLTVNGNVMQTAAGADGQLVFTAP